MSQLMSEPSNVDGYNDRASLPGLLWGALIVLVVQVIANGLVGWLVLASLSDEASHGATPAGAGVDYFAAYLSMAFAVMLAVCVVCTVRPRAWARTIIIIVETLAMISGLISVLNGAVFGLLGIVLAIVVVVVLMNADVQDWYRSARTER